MGSSSFGVVGRVDEGLPSCHRRHKSFIRRNWQADVNETLNGRIDEEVGADDGKFLPVLYRFWYPARLFLL